jgi:protoheme ferro-lyase
MAVQTTAEAIYGQVVKPLPLSERLKLATLILNDIPPRAVVDYSEEWTEEDMRDFTAASWAYITKKLEEEERDATTR